MKENAIAVFNSPLNQKMTTCLKFQYWFQVCVFLLRLSIYAFKNFSPQPENGLKSVTFWTEDAEGYREVVWSLNQKVADAWELGQVRISRDYDFIVKIHTYFRLKLRLNLFLFPDYCGSYQSQW